MLKKTVFKIQMLLVFLKKIKWDIFAFIVFAFALILFGLCVEHGYMNKRADMATGNYKVYGEARKN